jgi:hypothetical protein
MKTDFGATFNIIVTLYLTTTTFDIMFVKGILLDLV